MIACFCPRSTSRSTPLTISVPSSRATCKFLISSCAIRKGKPPRRRAGRPYRRTLAWYPQVSSCRSVGKVGRMPFGISLPELLILLIVLLLVFGAKRLPEMGRSLGKGMREFQDSVSGIDEPVATTTTPTPTRVELPSATPEQHLPPDD